jgi:putative transposase
MAFRPEGPCFLSPGHRPGYEGQRPSEIAVPQSLSHVLVHLVFSTKNRAPVLVPDIRAELHPYLSVVLNNDGCTSLRVGGIEDHVHLFFALSRTRTISQVVESAKTSSSKWLKTKSADLTGFRWQNGYGIFSVSQSHAGEVVEYIVRQEEHHRTEPFQQEVRRLYEREKIAYDERYLWD